MLWEKPAVCTYRLTPDTHAAYAAVRLWADRNRYGKDHPLPEDLSDAEAIAFKKKGYNELYDFMRRERVSQLRAVGLHAPVTAIYTYDVGYPRAYQQLPRLYKHYDDENYYVECPVDYQGHHFQPKDAQLMPARLNLGGQSGAPAKVGNDTNNFSYIMYQDMAGVQLPHDFDPLKHFTQPGTFNSQAKQHAAFVLNTHGFNLIDKHSRSSFMGGLKEEEEGVLRTLGFVPEFWAPDGSTPYIRFLGGSAMLIYVKDADAEFDFCPPGTKPLTPNAYAWLVTDEHDRSNGIFSKYCMPRSIEQELDSCDDPTPLLLDTLGMRPKQSQTAERPAPKG